MRGAEREGAGGGTRERTSTSSSGRLGGPPPSSNSRSSQYQDMKPTSRNPFAKPSRPAEDRKPHLPSSSHDGRGSNGSILPHHLPPPTTSITSTSGVASLSSRYTDWDQAPTNKTWYTLGELREIRDLMQLPERPHDLAPLIIAVEKNPHMRALNERRGSEDLSWAAKSTSTGKASPFAYKERIGEDRDARQASRDGGRKWSGDYTRKESPFQPRERERGGEHGDRDDHREGGRRRSENFGRASRDSPFGRKDGMDQQPDWDQRPPARKGSEDLSNSRGAGGRKRKEGLWDTPSSAFDGVDFDFTQGPEGVAAMEAERARFLGIQVRSLDDDNKPETPVNEAQAAAAPTPTPDVVDVSALESKMVQVMSLSALEDNLSAGAQGSVKPQPQPRPVVPSPEPQKLPSSINELQIDIDQLLFSSSGGAPLGGAGADTGAGAGEASGFADFDLGKSGGDPFRTGLFSFAAPGAAISTIDLYRELNHGSLFGDLQGGGGYRKHGVDEPPSSSSRLQAWSSQGGDGIKGVEVRGSKHDAGLASQPPPPTIKTTSAPSGPPNEDALLKTMLGIGQINLPRGPPPAPQPPPPPPPTNEQASNNLLEILGFAKKTSSPDKPPITGGTSGGEGAAPKQSPFAFHEKKAAPTRKVNGVGGGVRPAAPRPVVHQAHAPAHAMAPAPLIPAHVLARKHPANLPEQPQPQPTRVAPPPPPPHQPAPPSAKRELNPVVQALFAKVSPSSTMTTQHGPGDVVACPSSSPVVPPPSSDTAGTCYYSLAEIEKQVRK